MRIATWNVNSVRMRQAHVCRWLERQQPDLLLLQEIKTEAAGFPDVFAPSATAPNWSARRPTMAWPSSAACPSR